MPTLYFGIMESDGMWFPMEISPMTLNPLRFKEIREWEPKPTLKEAQAWLFNTLAMVTGNEALYEDIYVFAKPFNVKEKAS